MIKQKHFQLISRKYSCQVKASFDNPTNYVHISQLPPHYIFFLDQNPEFELVALRSICEDNYINVGRTSAKGCAEKCTMRGDSMFDLQRTEYCNGEDSCYCLCVTTANPGGPCAMTTDNEYDTYKILKGINHLLFRYIHWESLIQIMNHKYIIFAYVVNLSTSPNISLYAASLDSFKKNIFCNSKNSILYLLSITNFSKVSSNGFLMETRSAVVTGIYFEIPGIQHVGITTK